jgi:two-component system sensor histidine kinase VicK
METPFPSINDKTERNEIIYGQENAGAALLQILSRAKNMVDICTDFRAPSVSIEIESYNKALLGLKSRGVRFRQITEITKDNLSFSKELTRIAEVRHLDGVKGNFMTSEKEYLSPVVLFQKGKVTSQIIYSNVREVVEQFKYLFETLWTKAIPAKQKIQEIEEGIIPDVIEIIRDPIEIQNLFINLIKSSSKEIMIMIPTTNAIHCQADIGILQLLKKIATDNDVNIRILAPLNDYSVEQKVQNVLSCTSHSSTIQLRNIETSSATKSTIIIIDRIESLVTELDDDSKHTFVDALGFATYSNSRSTVLSYVSIFESFWLQTEMCKKIKETEMMQKEFIGIAAHELRNPIQPILGLAEILKSEIKDAEQYELLDVIIRNAKRLKRLTEDILDVTKIESQSLDLKKEQFNLSDVITNAMNDIMINIDFLRKSQRNAIKLLYPLPQDIFIQADKGRITQVILNLLSNAVKSTEEGTISVILEKNEDNDHVVISLKDTGTGIDPEILPRLFTKFARKSFTGTGLGLYISKSIVEAHGGKIGAENNSDGRGATFAFSLPLIIQQDSRQESMAINTTTAATMINDIEERIKTKMKRIFLVDDDYDHTITFKVGLEHAGFEVDAYNNSAIALSNFKPD